MLFIYSQLCGYESVRIVKSFFYGLERYMLQPKWWPIYCSRDSSGTPDISSIVQAWATDLRDAGINSLDLQLYGQYEESLFSPIDSNFEPPYFYIFDKEIRVRIIALRTGPEVSDWRAWLSDPWGKRSQMPLVNFGAW